MSPREADFGCKVEKNRRIRHRSFKNNAGDRPVERHELGAFAAVYLVGDRGECETVGDNGLTALKRGTYHFRDHLRARGEEKKKLRADVDTTRLIRHEKRPYLLTERSAAGILGVYEMGVLLFETVDECRFTRAVAALKNDEFSAHASFYPAQKLSTINPPAG